MGACGLAAGAWAVYNSSLRGLVRWSVVCCKWHQCGMVCRVCEAVLLLVLMQGAKRGVRGYHTMAYDAPPQTSTCHTYMDP